jgi:hypothetical protein
MRFVTATLFNARFFRRAFRCCAKSAYRHAGKPRGLRSRALAEVTPSDLDIAVGGEPALSELPLGDGLEPCPLQVVGLKTALGCRALR